MMKYADWNELTNALGEYLRGAIIHNSYKIEQLKIAEKNNICSTEIIKASIEEHEEIIKAFTRILNTKE